jgi:acyl-CoA hydrolase
MSDKTRMLPAPVALDGFAFRAILRPGDRIVFGQACSEPVALLRELLRQAEGLHATSGRLKLFVAGSFSGLLHPEHGSWFDFFSYGAIGDGAALARVGQLQIDPVHYSQLPALMAGAWRPDVVLLQLSGADANGRHSLGAASDYQLAAARHARVVIAEVNEHAPFSPHALLPQDMRIDHVVRSEKALVEVARAKVDTVSERVAAHVAGLVENGATLQMGIGSLMEAICRALASHRNLGIHSGILTDAMTDLMRQGVVTNSRKGSHFGRSVAGSLVGTRDLLDFAHRNDAIMLAETQVTHDPETLGRQHRLCAINSAIEVDLTGQVNAEVSAGRYIGAVGGQVDFVRAAARCEGGRSIIALPSTASNGSISRVVARLNGPVTTPRADVEYVVTEWGVACLRGLCLRERARAMAGIAHPDHREKLLRAGAELPGG